MMQHGYSQLATITLSGTVHTTCLQRNNWGTSTANRGQHEIAGCGVIKHKTKRGKQ